MSETLFVLGVSTSFILGLSSLLVPGDDKRGTVAFPFLMFTAAAVAKYIGF